jgi:hypothetical protein
MEMRIKAGYCVDIAHVKAARLRDGFHLVPGDVTVLPLHRLEVLKNAIGVVRFWTNFDKRAAWDRHEYALEHPHLDEARTKYTEMSLGEIAFAGAQLLDYNKRKFLK